MILRAREISGKKIPWFCCFFQVLPPLAIFVLCFFFSGCDNLKHTWTYRRVEDGNFFWIWWVSKLKVWRLEDAFFFVPPDFWDGRGRYPRLWYLWSARGSHGNVTHGLWCYLFKPLFDGFSPNCSASACVFGARTATAEMSMDVPNKPTGGHPRGGTVACVAPLNIKVIRHHTFIATCMWHLYLATTTPSFAGQNKAKRDYLRRNPTLFQSWLWQWKAICPVWTTPSTVERLGNGFPIFGEEDDDDDDDDDDHALLQLSIHWVDTTGQLFY